MARILTTDGRLILDRVSVSRAGEHKFLTRDLEVVRVVEGLKPWRLARAGGAKRILELGTGEAARLRIAVGDRLVLDEAA